MLLNLIRIVRDWQEGQVCAACGERIRPGTKHPKCEIRMIAQDFPRCKQCDYPVLPGYPHYACDKLLSESLTSVHQCIYCLKDERVGDHAKCRHTLGRYVGKKNKQQIK